MIFVKLDGAVWHQMVPFGMRWYHFVLDGTMWHQADGSERWRTGPVISLDAILNLVFQRYSVLVKK